jgi:hypothetical protein
MRWLMKIWFGQALEDVTGPYKMEKKKNTADTNLQASIALSMFIFTLWQM